MTEISTQELNLIPYLNERILVIKKCCVHIFSRPWFKVCPLLDRNENKKDKRAIIVAIILINRCLGVLELL